MPDYAAIQAAIEQDALRQAGHTRASQAVLAQQLAQEQYNNKKQYELQVADKLAREGNFAGAAALQSKYVPVAPAVVASPTSGVTSHMANAYVPPKRVTPTTAPTRAPRSTSAPRKAGGSGTSGTSGTSGRSGTTSKTVTAVAAPAKPAATAAPTYVPTQVAPGGVQAVRQPTPCELGLGGCEDPVNVASNVAAWQLNGNQPLSVHDQRYLQPLMQQASQGEVAAAQAGAATLYDRSVANPAFESTVRNNVSAGMPYGVAAAQARSQLTPSGYAENLLGTPNVIRATDAAASQDQAAAAVSNVPYEFRYNGNTAGYVPAVQGFDPTNGNYTVNNATYTNTGLSGADVPIVVGQSIAPGMAGYIPTALQNIATVGKATQTAATTNAKMEQALAKQDLANQGALAVAQQRTAGDMAVAQQRAAARQSGLPVAPVARIK